VEGPIDKLTTDAPSGANAGSLLGHLASDKIDGGGMILQIFLLSMMPRIMIGSHPDRGCSLPLRIFQNRDCKEFTCCYAKKGSESQLVVHSFTTPIDDHHVKVSPHVVVPSLLRPTSPQRAKSPRDTKAPIKTPIDGHHVEVSVIVTVPSSSRHTSPRKAKSLEDVKALLPDNDKFVL